MYHGKFNYGDLESMTMRDMIKMREYLIDQKNIELEAMNKK